MDAKKKALDFIMEWGGTDGSFHKQWVLDGVVRILTETEDGYNQWLTEHNDGEDGPDTYAWDEGSAP